MPRPIFRCRPSPSRMSWSLHVAPGDSRLAASSTSSASHCDTFSIRSSHGASNAVRAKEAITTCVAKKYPATPSLLVKSRPLARVFCWQGLSPTSRLNFSKLSAKFHLIISLFKCGFELTTRIRLHSMCCERANEKRDARPGSATNDHPHSYIH